MATQPGETPNPAPGLPEQDVPISEPAPESPRPPNMPDPPRQPGEVDNPDLPGQDLPRRGSV